MVAIELTVSTTVSSRLVPAGRSPTVHKPLMLLNVLPSDPVTESMVTPAGSVVNSTSDTTTPLASEGPEFVAVIVYVRFPVPLPAMTGSLASVFVNPTSTFRTTFVGSVAVSFLV